MKKNRAKRYQVATFLLKCIGVTLFFLFAFSVMADVDLTDDDSSVESVDADVDTDVDSDVSSSRWDIPPESKNMPWKDDREKQFCACPLLYESDRDHFCYNERPFYYMIKVENWGRDVAQDVWVSDELAWEMNYIPGTAEIATRFDENKGCYVDWKLIEDNSGETPAEKFPLSGKGVKVADEMSVCDSNTWTCKDSRLIRFLVKPLRDDFFPVTTLLRNVAVITDASGAKYKTNNAWPIPLTPADCIGVGDCPQPNKWDCGGVNQIDDKNGDADNITDIDDDFTETSDGSSETDDGDMMHTKKSSSCSAVLIK